MIWDWRREQLNKVLHLFRILLLVLRIEQFWHGFSVEQAKTNFENVPEVWSLTFVKTMVTTRESRAMAVRNWINWIIIAWTQCSVVDLEPYPIVVWPSKANRNAVVKSKTWSTHVSCSSYVPSFQAVISPFCHAINQYISPNNSQRPKQNTLKFDLAAEKKVS